MEPRHPRQMPKIRDSLLLHPSSKIVSSDKGQLSFRGEVLTKIIHSYQRVSSHPVDDRIPINLLSIVGDPSDEKKLLLRSFLNHYENGMGDSGQMDQSNGSDQVRFTPNLKDSSSSGVYLLHKPFHADVKEKARFLVWIMFMYHGESGTSRDTHLLERFLLLVSSRIAEVSFEMDEVRMLKQWQQLQDKTQYPCDSFLYVLPTDNTARGRTVKLFTDFEARERLLTKLARSGDRGFDLAILGKEKIRDINLIEMNGMHQIDWDIAQQFLNRIEELHRVSRLCGNFDKKEYRCLRLRGFAQFVGDCVASVAGYSREMVRGAAVAPGKGPPPIAISRHPQYINQDTRLAAQDTSEPAYRVADHDQEEQVARKLIPEVVTFYNEEMKRFLSEGLYAPAVLNNIHKKLSISLSSNFRKIFDLDSYQHKMVRTELQSALNACFSRHLEQNSRNLKMKQAKISKCLHKMTSLYMERIDNVLLHNPQGLPGHQLEGANDKIVYEIKERLGSEIRENIREDEPLAGHLSSLQAEMDEYWESVQDRNRKNMEWSRNSKMRKADDVASYRREESALL